MQSPFEVPFEQVQSDLDAYVTEVFASLTSDFLVLPRGSGFVDYAVFEAGYEALKRVTRNFEKVDVDGVTRLAFATPISLIILRCILGFTPPEWAYLAAQESGIEIPQGAARSIDKRVRSNPLASLKADGVTAERVKALVRTACSLLEKGAPQTEVEFIHRLDKVDTKHGLESTRPLAQLGVPYPVLLYERFLGRPFAGHRDAVSELVGDIVETAIETVLTDHGISFRKTKRAERVTGFEQAPDFIIPNEFNPQIVIEAKLTEDDGTARDKVTRVQHLDRMSQEGQPANAPRYEVVACIAGRGFGVRREDMKKLLVATRGKVFTLQNLTHLIEHTGLKKFATKEPPQPPAS